MGDQAKHDRLSAAVQALDAAWDDLQEAMAGGDQRKFSEKFAAFEAASDEYERALLDDGKPPPWPPRTDEGCDFFGMTRAQVDDLIVRGHEAQ